MDGGGSDRPPYWAARKLLLWARESWNALDAELLWAGRESGADGLTMRQVCNVAYGFITREMTPRRLEQFDAELNSDPRRQQRTSRGTSDLMAVMMQFSRPQPGGESR